MAGLVVVRAKVEEAVVVEEWGEKVIVRWVQLIAGLWRRSQVMPRIIGNERSGTTRKEMASWWDPMVREVGQVVVVMFKVVPDAAREMR
jgi:hypothetical protein